MHMKNMYLDNVDGFSNLDILLSHGFYHILFAIFKVCKILNELLILLKLVFC